MLAGDYARRKVRRYARRAEHFRSFYQTTVEQFSKQVTNLAQGSGQLSLLADLEWPERLLRAEDDLEEWEAAEDFLARWRAVEVDLQDAPAA